MIQFVKQIRPNLCLCSNLPRKWFLGRFECVCIVLSLLVCLSVLKFSFAFFESSIVFYIVILRLNQAIILNSSKFVFVLKSAQKVVFRQIWVCLCCFESFESLWTFSTLFLCFWVKSKWLTIPPNPRSRMIPTYTYTTIWRKEGLICSFNLISYKPQSPFTLMSNLVRKCLSLYL